MKSKDAQAKRKGEFMEEKINKLHEMIKEIFPDAVSVKVFVNSEGIDAIPNYKTNLRSFSMRTITGKWVQRKPESTF